MYVHLVAEYSHDEICRKPDAGFLRWKCTTAAAVYLRSAYRIHVNAMKANRARWVLTQVNSLRRDEVSATLNLVLLWELREPRVFSVTFHSLLRDCSPTSSVWQRTMASRNAEARIIFVFIIFPSHTKIFSYRSIENLFIKIHALFHVIKLKKMKSIMQIVHSLLDSFRMLFCVQYFIYFLWIFCTHFHLIYIR